MVRGEAATGEIVMVTRCGTIPVVVVTDTRCCEAIEVVIVVAGSRCATTVDGGTEIRGGA